MPTVEQWTGPRRRAHTLWAMHVMVAEQRCLPAAERVERHGHRNWDINADHADLDLVGELPGGVTISRKDRSAIAELVLEAFGDVAGPGAPMAHSARRVTTKVPIVMANSTDPVRAGIVASLARHYSFQGMPRISGTKSSSPTTSQITDYQECSTTEILSMQALGITVSHSCSHKPTR